MLPADHNGEKFRYVVRYKRISPTVSDTTVQTIEKWRQNELVVENQPTFAQYEISVEAVNDLGSAPAELLATVIGHSGEDGEQIIQPYVLFNTILQLLFLSLT
jgi:hypothetical protein